MEQVVFFLKDFSSHCDVDLEDRNTDMSHGIPGHGDIATHQVSLTCRTAFRVMVIYQHTKCH